MVLLLFWQLITGFACGSHSPSSRTGDRECSKVSKLISLNNREHKIKWRSSQDFIYNCQVLSRDTTRPKQPSKRKRVTCLALMAGYFYFHTKLSQFGLLILQTCVLRTLNSLKPQFPSHIPKTHDTLYIPLSKHSFNARFSAAYYSTTDHPMTPPFQQTYPSNLTSNHSNPTISPSIRITYSTSTSAYLTYLCVSPTSLLS